MSISHIVKPRPSAGSPGSVSALHGRKRSMDLSASLCSESEGGPPPSPTDSPLSLCSTEGALALRDIAILTKTLVDTKTETAAHRLLKKIMELREQTLEISFARHLVAECRNGNATTLSMVRRRKPSVCELQRLYTEKGAPIASKVTLMKEYKTYVTDFATLAMYLTETSTFVQSALEMMRERSDDFSDGVLSRIERHSKQLSRFSKLPSLRGEQALLSVELIIGILKVVRDCIDADCSSMLHYSVELWNDTITLAEHHEATELPPVKMASGLAQALLFKSYDEKEGFFAKGDWTTIVRLSGTRSSLVYIQPMTRDDTPHESGEGEGAVSSEGAESTVRLKEKLLHVHTRTNYGFLETDQAHFPHVVAFRPFVLDMTFGMGMYGKSLREVITSGARYSKEALFKIAVSFVDAVNLSFHKKGFLHGNLSFDHVLLDGETIHLISARPCAIRRLKSDAYYEHLRKELFDIGSLLISLVKGRVYEEEALPPLKSTDVDPVLKKFLTNLVASDDEVALKAPSLFLDQVDEILEGPYKE